MVGCSSANADLWEGIKKKYTLKLSDLEETESELRYKVQALERLADRSPDPCLCDNKKTKRSPQIEFQCPPVDLSAIPKVVDECPCKPCGYKTKFNTDKCGCTGNTDQCGCSDEPPKEPKCDCNEKQLQALLQQIEQSAPDILARDVPIPPTKPIKKGSKDCSCDVDKALKTKILPIIDEMLDDFCSACDDVQNVFSPLQSKHKCSCFNMLALSPSACTCISKKDENRPDSRRRPSSSRGKHPDGCECRSCVCDPCNVGKGSSRIIRTHEQICECVICECDSCGLQPASRKGGAGAGCSCSAPGERRKSSDKARDKHGSTCECLECVCEPCTIQQGRNSKIPSSTRKGCQCGDSALNNAFVHTTARPPTDKRRTSKSKNGCSCVQPPSRQSRSGASRPTSASSRASRMSSRPTSASSRATSRHDTNCDCIECLCAPCGVDLNNNTRSSRSSKTGCKCDDSASKKPVRPTVPRPSTDSRRDSKSKGKCSCDSRIVGGQAPKKTQNHAPDCDCDTCMCDPCGVSVQSSKDAGKHGLGCDCEICECEDCGPDGKPTKGAHDPNCDCSSCACDPCGTDTNVDSGVTDTESCACGECICEKCKKQMTTGKQGKSMVDCGCDPCTFETNQKPKRESIGCGPKPSPRKGSRIPVAQGCICKDPCPCDPCYFDNSAMEELTRSALGGQGSCGCQTQERSKGIRTKLIKARNQISNMSLGSVDINHMKEIIQMYNEQKSLKRRIRELESKQKNLKSNGCR